MSGTSRIGLAAALALAVLAGAGAEAAEGYCANGAVNTITNNYTPLYAGAPGADTALAPSGCEICLIVRVPEAGAAGGWEEVGRVCNVWTDAQAHELMFRIGQCGLIVPQFERPGVFYGHAVPLRIEAVRQPPCV
jgi:hypothetical protein